MSEKDYIVKFVLCALILLMVIFGAFGLKIMSLNKDHQVLPDKNELIEFNDENNN